MSSQNVSQKKFKVTKTLVIVSALATVALVAVSVSLSIGGSAAQPSVELGLTKPYAVLAGSGITNTGPTTVSGTYGGNLGSSPTGTFTGDTLVTTTGTKFTAVDAQTTAAKVDLTTAYNDAANRTPATTVTADLGGQTLTQGVYNGASTLAITGTLTLDAENDPDAVFIFQAGSTLTTASSSTVALVNGAQACNVFWQVGSSATFGTNSTFVGHVFALTSITATTGATFQGQLLAINGAVTLDTNTIVNDACVTAATPTPSESVTATPTSTPTATPTSTPTATPTTSSTPDATVAPSPEATEEEEVVQPQPERSTDTGGQLPDTDGFDWLTPLAIGLLAIVAGSAIFVIRRRRS